MALRRHAGRRHDERVRVRAFKALALLTHRPAHAQSITDRDGAAVIIEVPGLGTARLVHTRCMVTAFAHTSVSPFR